MEFERSDRFDERQKTALLYTSHLVWNPDGVDQALIERLQSHFSEAQLAELGYFVALTFGQQRWIKTLGIGHGEVKVPGVGAGRGGLAAEEARR